MTSLTSDLLQQLQGQPMSQLSRQLALSSEQTSGAVLDQDGDGSFGLSDLLRVGGSLLGGKR